MFDVPGSGGTTIVDNIAALTVGSTNTDGIDFSLSAASYTINPFAASGYVLTLGSAGTGIGFNDLSLNAETISVPLTLASTQTINVGNRAGSLTLSGVISQAAAGYGITKNGNGLLTLSGANTFTGPVTINGGVISISADSTSATNQLGSGAAGALLVLNGGTLRTTASTQLSTNRGITLGSSGGTLDVNSGTLTYNGVIASSANALTKTGSGTLTLGGANLYTGNTNVNQGTLTLDFAQLVGTTTNIINSGSTLAMGGFGTSVGVLVTSPLLPTLNVSGKSTASTNVSQTFTNGITLNQGSSTIKTTQPTATSSVLLSLGAINHNVGGAVNFSLAGTASSTNAITTSNTNDASGIIGGYATYNGADYATVGANGITAYTGYTTVASGAAIADSGAATATNINLTSGGTVTLSGTTNGATNVNTIRQGSATAATINVGTGGVLRLGVNGGILQSVNVANSGGASLTIGTGTGAGGGILTAGGNTLGTAGEITISQVASRINNQIVINSVVANNNASSGAANSTGGGAVTLTINAPAEGTNGTSALVLNGANTYSGGTYINDGRVGTGNNSAFGTGNVYLLQGSQVIASSNTFANNFFLAGGGADSGGFVSLRGGSYNGVITLMGDARIGGGATFNGQITGGYNLEFNNGT